MSDAAKLFLMRVEIYDALINSKIEEKEKLWSMLTKITPTLKEDVGVGGTKDVHGDEAMAKLADLETEINQQIDTFVDAKRAVNSIIDQLDDADQISVLHKRYIQYKRWEQIATEMNMSYRNVWYIHNKALKTVHELMKKDGLT